MLIYKRILSISTTHDVYVITPGNSCYTDKVGVKDKSINGSVTFKYKNNVSVEE